MTDQKTSKTNNDWYQAILILGTSVIVSGLILLFAGHILTTIMGTIKLMIGIPIVAYTLKHGIGKRPVEARLGIFSPYSVKNQEGKSS